MEQQCSSLRQLISSHPDDMDYEFQLIALVVARAIMNPGKHWCVAFIKQVV